jgi:hypothetical protein
VSARRRERERERERERGNGGGERLLDRKVERENSQLEFLELFMTSPRK